MPTTTAIRAAVRASDGTEVRRALVELAAAQAAPSRQDRRRGEWVPSGERVPRGALCSSVLPLSVVVTTWAAAVAVFTLLLAMAGAVSTDRPAACAAVSYTWRGAAPRLLSQEFAVAAAEIERRTGVRFVPSTTHDAALVIEWSAQSLETRGAGLEPKAARRIGSAVGHWRRDGGALTLGAGLVILDGTWPWKEGIEKGDGLAAGLVHELGHVLGLDHSDDPASYMYAKSSPDARRWTDGDLAALAEVSRRTGCAPPG